MNEKCTAKGGKTDYRVDYFNKSTGGDGCWYTCNLKPGCQPGTNIIKPNGGDGLMVILTLFRVPTREAILPSLKERMGVGI